MTTNSNELNEEMQEALDRLEAAEDALVDAQLEKKNAARALADLAVDNFDSKTFEHNGTLYQIRVRKGNPYVVTLKEPPQVSLKRARDERIKEEAAKLVEAQASQQTAAADEVVEQVHEPEETASDDFTDNDFEANLMVE